MLDIPAVRPFYRELLQRYTNWKNHPFAQLGNEIVVDPLPPRAAEELIIRPFRALGFEFEESGLVCRILSMANYHPGLIQIFCYRLLVLLYKGWRQWNSPLRKVTADDILNIERDPSFREDVRNRFDWTLDLDDRYKVLTYGLVLSDNPTDAKSTFEFKALGEYWWPKVFDGMDTQAIRAVLDEMVGLGVLVTEHNDELPRQYRLRSPNLLRLLGPRETIEAELLRIMSVDRRTRFNPRNFRTLFDSPDKFGPFTREQEGHISDVRDLFSLVVVPGCTAGGLRQAEEHVRRVMEDAADAVGTSWEHFTIPSSGGSTTATQLVGRLGRKLSQKRRRHRFTIINFEELVLEAEVGEFLEAIHRELRKACRSDSRGMVVVALEPSSTWKWTCSQFRHGIEERPTVSVMNLRRWTPGAISNALDRVGLRTGSKAAGKAIHEVTGGVHQLVSEVLGGRKSVKGSSAETLTKVAEEVRSRFENEDPRRALKDLGVLCGIAEIESAAIEVVRWSEGDEGNQLITEDSFVAAMDELQSDSAAWRILQLKRTELQQWLQALGLIWPSDEHRNEYSVCPITSRLIDSL